MTPLKMPTPGAGAPGGGETNSTQTPNFTDVPRRLQPPRRNRFVPPPNGDVTPAAC